MFNEKGRSKPLKAFFQNVNFFYADCSSFFLNPPVVKYCVITFCFPELHHNTFAIHGWCEADKQQIRYTRIEK